MKPKTISILYWVFTILFAVVMLFASIPSVLVTEDSKKLIHDMLGYPVYFIPFTGVAKVIGVIAILIPGKHTFKEWAYAGLFFDLAGAVYSSIAASKGNIDPRILGMLVWIVPGILSYIYYHKKYNASTTIARALG